MGASLGSPVSSPPKPRGRPFPDIDLWSKVVRTLQENPDGLTILEVSEKAGVRRQTVAVYLDTLLRIGSATIRKVGKAKIYRSLGNISEAEPPSRKPNAEQA